MRSYLRFEEIVDLSKKLKTKRYLVLNEKFDEEIGLIKWYGAWRQYCFFSHHALVLHDGCAEELRNFLSQLKKERKEQKRKEKRDKNG